MEIIDKTPKAERDDLIKRIYNLSKGNVLVPVDMLKIAEFLNMDRKTLDGHIRYFVEKKQLKPGGMGDDYFSVQITALGIDYVEQLPDFHFSPQ